jgi:hypothetical protein
MTTGNLVLDIEALLELMTRFTVYDLRALVLLTLGSTLRRERICHSSNVAVAVCRHKVHTFAYLQAYLICIYVYSLYRASVSPGFVQQIMPFVTQLMLLLQFSHLNGLKLDHRQV